MKKIRNKLIASFLGVTLITGGQTGIVLASTISNEPEVQAATVAPPESWGALPSAPQLKYHKQKVAGFIHYGVNTYNDIEWGSGNESPAIFNPTELDPEQWVKSFVDAGIKKIIFVAKHHDGFVMYESQYTEHDVMSSPVKRDVLAELSAACTKYDVDMGVYLSPWDVNAPSYGAGPTDPNDPFSDPYNDYYVNQLEEIFSNPKYGNNGEFVELWLDGAKGDNVQQDYDFDRWISTTRKYEPNCIVFGNGEVSWVGNEQGYMEDDIKSLNTEGNWTVWEADVSIRPGWFYHQSQDGQVKSPEYLTDLYFRSVGRGGVLLLNIPPDKRGIFHENDVNNVKAFGKIIEDTFAEDFIEGESVSIEAVTGVRGNDTINYGVQQMIDAGEGYYDTYWTMDDDQRTGSFIVDLGKEQIFDVVEIQEYIPLGQRIDSYKVEYLNQKGEWVIYGQGKTVGSQRLVKGNPIRASKVRITVSSKDAVPIINNVGIYKLATVLEGNNTVPKGLEFVDDAVMDKTGIWESDAEDFDFIDASCSWTSEQGATATTQFEGTKCYINGVKGPEHGTIEVIIDEGMPQEIRTSINTHESSKTPTKPLYASPDLEEGMHTIKLVNQENKKMQLDAVSYLNNQGKGIFEFEQTAMSTPEGNHAIEVTVKRVGGSKGRGMVRVQTYPDTAVQGEDFVQVAEELLFEEGEIQKTVSIGIIDNFKTEGNQSFNVALESIKGDLLTSFNKELVVTILDNDVDANTNFALRKKATSNHHIEGYEPSKAVDGNTGTRWGALGPAWGGPDTHWFRVDFGGDTTFNKIIIKEAYNRIKKFKIEYLDGGEWKVATEGTTVGDNKTLTFDPVTGSAVRLSIEQCDKKEPTIWEFEVYNTTLVDRAGLNHAISAAQGKVKEEYTEVSWQTMQCALDEAKQVASYGEITQEMLDEATSKLNQAIQNLVRIPTAQMNLALNQEATSTKIADAGYEANKAVDGNTGTRWGALGPAWGGPEKQWLQIDFKVPTRFDSIIMKEAFDRIQSFKIEYLEGEEWKVATQGTTVGSHKELNFEAVTGTAVRLFVDEATKKEPTLWEFEVYHKAMGDKKELGKLIQEANKKVEADYTVASWAIFSEALATANTVRESSLVVQQEVDAARDALQQTMENLVLDTERSAAVTLLAPKQVVGGKNFEVTVGMEALEQSAYAQDITLTYDSEAFEFVGVKGIDPTKVVSDKRESGKVRILAATEGGILEDTETMTLEFVAKREKDQIGIISVSEASLGLVQEGTSEILEVQGQSISVEVKQTGTGDVDKTGLLEVIEEATVLSQEASIGDGIGQYPASAKERLDAAIEEAKQVAEHAEEQIVIDLATSTLREAINTFRESVLSERAKDINEDGKVDIADLALVAYHYQKTSTDEAWESVQKADINRDNKIDIEDLGRIAEAILAQ